MFRNNKSMFFITIFITLAILNVSSAWAAVDISDVPLDAQTKAAPANIMFVLDDSGSMDWEFMTVESNGLFSGELYVFDNPGDNLYSDGYILNAVQRLMWKSQWFEHNKMYYNPTVEYTHWPTLPDADPDNPRSHPAVSGTTFNLSNTYVSASLYSPTAGSEIIVDNQDTGFSILDGSWSESAATPEYNNSSLYSSDSGASASWDANLPTSGDYQVWAWWSSRADFLRDTNGRYRVNHVSGTSDYFRDMNVDYGQWNLLGIHTFNSGTNTVTLLRGNNTTNADAVKFVQVSGGTLNIPRAHYYVYSALEGRPYLITIDGGTINYYAVTISGTGSTESVNSLQPVTNPPTDVLSSRTYTEERQNFANWYSFYRRRELTATAAVSNVISQMAGVQIGITSINDRINQPVMQIKVGGVDQTSALLTTLYSLVLQANGTPLRRGLQDAGQYFDQDDGDNGDIGSCPYWSAANGGACQQAFAILMTDGFWNGSDPGVGNADGDNGDPFADTYTSTLGDVAMTYWENDLSNGLANLLSSSDVDPATWQHMVTYGISFGVTGTLDPENYDLSASPPPHIPWPSPWAGNPEKIDDLYHASVDGHGVFLSAADPTELIDSLLTIMQNIKNRIGSASSVSVNGDELYKQIDNNTYMFQSSYNTIGWLGDIKSFKVDATTGAIDLLNPEWSAATVWQSYNWATYWDTRAIATYDGSSGITFRIGSLTADQQDDLDPTLSVATDILNYVRGNDSLEQINGGTFRNRTSRLGDIVHSSPTYHEGLLYAGANDGMLHVIVAEGANAGRELFSYVPSQVIGNLSLLSSPSYAHKYYVDSTATVKDGVTIGGTDKTLLVGGLGQGGMGYYALDVSGLTTYNTTTQLWQPTAISESSVAGRVLWEFPKATTSTANKADIGYSFSKALVVKTNDVSHPWVVIFGNGYNSPDGQSVLFILDPATGDVLCKFELGSGPDNGLSTPAITDVDGNGTADYVYAGDLAGNLWKIDLTSTSLANWEPAFFQSGVASPLFRAVGPAGDAQPITSKPDVMYHLQQRGYMVLFGTGKFLGTSDFTDTRVQTVYGLWDYGDDDDDTESLGEFDHSTEQVADLSSRSTLLEQTRVQPATGPADFFYDPDGDGDGEIIRIISDNAIQWVTELDSNSSQLPNPSTSVDNNVGWYFDLPNAGERVISRMMIRDGKAIFISFMPNLQPCTPGGNSILHEVDASDGSRLNQPVFDVNLDGVVDVNDMVQIQVMVDGVTTTISVAPTGVQREGHLQTPAILKLGKEEIKYMSSTAGSIETVKETAAKIGISSWREF